MYDVIVIGAGPAGCTAAKVLAESGRTVLLMERYKMPRYKSCSGQLIQKSLHLVQRYFGEPVPDSVTCAPSENRGMILTDAQGKTYAFEQEGRNVWRSTFDGWLAEKAAQSGAHVRDGVAVLSCEERDGAVQVVIKDESTRTERAKFVIVCEGVTGTVKRQLLGRPASCITTYQTFNEGSIDLDYRYFYAYLQPTLSEYDAWFNVKDNRLVLGVAVKDAKKAEHYYARFIAYMREKHNLRIDTQIKVDKWLMPHIRSGCTIDYSVGHILFAGEVAGFLNPMGEGISAAMESGYGAAKAVAAHYDNLDAVYADYKSAVRDLHRYMQRQWNFVANLTDAFGEMKMKK